MKPTDEEIRTKLGRPLTTDQDYRPHGMQHFMNEKEEEDHARYELCPLWPGILVSPLAALVLAGVLIVLGILFLR